LILVVESLPHNILSLIDSRLKFNLSSHVLLLQFICIISFNPFLLTIVLWWWSIIEYFIADFHTRMSVSHQSDTMIIALGAAGHLDGRWVLSFLSTPLFVCLKDVVFSSVGEQRGWRRIKIVWKLSSQFSPRLDSSLFYLREILMIGPFFITL